MRTCKERLRAAAVPLIAGPQYKRLARFSSDMRTCARSALGPVKSLELCLKPLARSGLGDRWAAAATDVQRGSSLADALRPGEPLLPAFYLPTIEAGETSGRVEESFEFLHRHCNLLAGPAAAVRHLWLFPLAIVLAGLVIKVVILAATGSPFDALLVLVSELVSLIKLVIIVAVVMLTPLRQLFDQVRLSLPWVGDLEREIAVHRFFRVMALLYSVSGTRVESMIGTAARTVSNHAARADLLRASAAIEKQDTISEAFYRVSLLNDQERGMIDAGELSGRLERSFDQIADDAESSLMNRLTYLQPLLNRLVMALVIFSIISTLLGVILR